MSLGNSFSLIRVISRIHIRRAIFDEMPTSSTSFAQVTCWKLLLKSFWQVQILLTRMLTLARLELSLLIASSSLVSLLVFLLLYLTHLLDVFPSHFLVLTHYLRELVLLIHWLGQWLLSSTLNSFWLLCNYFLILLRLLRFNILHVYSLVLQKLIFANKVIIFKLLACLIVVKHNFQLVINVFFDLDVVRYLRSVFFLVINGQLLLVNGTIVFLSVKNFHL